MKIVSVDRRSFLKLTGLSASGLIVGFSLRDRHPFAPETGAPATFQPNVFVRVEPDGSVHLTVHRSEMGQGTRTACAMIIAEELDVDWNSVSVEQADGHPRYGDQNTDGSRSIRTQYTRLRQAGAAARGVLVQAAASRWGVPAAECATDRGAVTHPGTNRSAGYGELADAAGRLPVPANPILKQRADFGIIGTDRAMIDGPDIVTGRAVYAADVRLSGMSFASIERCPRTRGRVASFDGSRALAVPGVTGVFEVGGYRSGLATDGVAVVANSTWAALEGRRALEIEWTLPDTPGETTADYRESLRALAHSEGRTVREEGAALSIIGSTPDLQAEYHSPYLVHSPMEPPVCTAWVRGDTCEIWAPSQSPGWARSEVAAQLGIPEDNVTYHVTLLGGGFGRKSKPDFAVEAAVVANHVEGPVQVVWTREDEVRHGFYRAENHQLLRAAIGPDGYPTAWHHRTVFPGIGWSFEPGGTGPSEGELAQGFTNMPYRIPNVRLEAVSVPSDLRIGWMRSVCHTFHAWAVNCFIDELAHEAGRDPVSFHRDLLGPARILEFTAEDRRSPYKFDTGRLTAVLESAAAMARWKRPAPGGHGWGIAAHYSFNSYVAMAVLVDVSSGKVKVREVHAAVDVGTAVNPTSVRAQIEGAVIFALTAAFYGEITVQDGVVQQSNFGDYRMLRINDAPRVEVDIIRSDAPPTGIGEPGVPPVAPAVCNAIFDATGVRVRELPLALQGLV